MRKPKTTQPRKEIIGKNYGRLTVSNIFYKFEENENQNRLYCTCSCLCGNTIDIKYNKLQSKNTKSCGCLRIENGINWSKSHKRENKYDLNQSFGIGYFYNTDENFYFDLEDYEKIKKYCWYSDDYACCFHNGKRIKMHRLILNIGDKNIKIDHINRNVFDNRKNNLRIANHSENRINSSIRRDNKSGIIGVCFRDNGWCASIQKNKKRISKKFKNFHDAALWRLEKENEVFKEFAPQKNLFDEYGVK